MTATDTSDVGFTDTEVDQFVEYRPVSRLAVASFILGIASVSALTHPVLWCVPVLSVVLAVAALRQMAQSGQAFRGRALATVAVTLAVLFGSFGATWHLSRHYALTRQARRFTEGWLELVRAGRIHEAHQMTEPYAGRLGAGDSLEEAYSEAGLEGISPDDWETTEPTPELVKLRERAELVQSYRLFTEGEPLSLLVASPESLEFEYQRNVLLVRRASTHLVFDQLYTVSFDQDGQTRTIQIEVSTERYLADDDVFWQITSVSYPDES